MKKAIAIFLLLSVMLVLLCACQTSNDPDVWNGEIADHFAGGDGSKTSPYQIQTAAQLAFLAQEINSGKDYKGKFFSLLRDLDLNNIEWTPIGNGDHTFEGTFDGKRHTISNLKISDVVRCEKAIVSAGRTYTLGIAGLFGTCKNVTIQNLSIHDAKVTVNYMRSYDETCGGILIGLLETNSACHLESIKISDASIDLPIPQEPGSSNVCLGGIVGSLLATGDGKQQCTMKQLESIVKISCLNGQVTSPNLGGIIGEAGGPRLTLECSDFHSDLTVDLAEPMIDNAPAGAFGWLGAQQLVLSNAFCLTRLHRTFGNFALENAVIGDGSLWATTVKCKNLYGCVIPENENSLMEPSGYEIDDATRKKSFQSLYRFDISEKDGGSLTEENCLPCSSLPEHHGLNGKVWDLSDLSNPKLK